MTTDSTKDIIESQEEWGYFIEDGDDKSECGFASAEEAEQDAIVYVADFFGEGEEVEVVIDTVKHVHTDDFFDFDAASILEAAEDAISETASFDEYSFEYRKGKDEAAQKDLSKIIKAWARRWIEHGDLWYANGKNRIVKTIVGKPEDEEPKTTEDTEK